MKTDNYVRYEDMRLVEHFFKAATKENVPMSITLDSKNYKGIPEGFKAMVPAILILTFAWSISGIMGARGGYLDAQAFVETHLANSAFPQFLFPAIFFILAALGSEDIGSPKQKR